MFQKRTKFYVHIDRNETEMCVEWNNVANKTQVYTRDRRTDRQANVTDGRKDGNLQQDQKQAMIKTQTSRRHG